ncbi:ACP S-malonyltransferase [Granulosicoccaceae sp. 1_MG-2023]|nr:ACP S-malonyltransferase [Granulosicoccaceae sp. 1_MG-2023]
MKFAAVFPGQGSQSVGMLADLHGAYAGVRDTFAEAADVLGYDIWSLIQNGPEDKLKLTEYTQPVMFVSGVAVWRAWREAGGADAALMAGHSLGEYSALTAAGVFSFADALALVAERGRLMAAAVPDGVGGMAAVLGMDDDAIAALCEQLNGERVVQAVNFNSPGQVVISGHLDALEKACEQAKEAGARRAMLLPVSVPNHSSLMDGVVAPLADKIRSTARQDARVPVVQNLTARPSEDLSATIDLLTQHVNHPVYWTDSVRFMAAEGTGLILEMGPGKVLTGLNKRIDKSLAGACIEDVASLEKALALVNE